MKCEEDKLREEERGQTAWQGSLSEMDEERRQKTREMKTRSWMRL